MSLEKLKKRFDDALAGMTDEEIIAEFARMGCQVTIGDADETETELTEQTFLMTRFSGLEEIDCIATITLAGQFDNSPEGRAQLWESFREAITEWVRTTHDGRQCWDESSQDLNIGDLLNHGALTNPELIQLLQENGIERASAGGSYWDQMRSYDEVLVDDPDEIEETDIDGEDDES